MFTKAELHNGVLRLYGGGKATTPFRMGSIRFCPETATIEVGKYPALPLPQGLHIADQAIVRLALYEAESGTPRCTRDAPNGLNREVQVVQSKDGKMYFAKGKGKSPRRNAGWHYFPLKFFSCLTHTGVDTDTELPDWLRASIRRQREFGNRLSYLCRRARRECSDIPPEAVVAFVKEQVLPAIDKFNRSLSSRTTPKRAKGAMKYPKDLVGEEANASALWKLISKLKKREAQGLPVPEGLETICREFAKAHKADYSGLQVFQPDMVHTLIDAEAMRWPQTRFEQYAARNVANWDTLSDEERNSYWDSLPEEERNGYIRRFRLRSWELAPVKEGFISTLKRRETLHQPFTKGWPRNKQETEYQWSIHYPSSKTPNVKLPLVLTEKGAFGLHLGDAISTAQSGHTEMGVSGKYPNRASRRVERRQLRSAKITIPDQLSGERWHLRFAVLQSRPFPEEANIKDWKLLGEGNRLTAVCLTTEVPPSSAPAPKGQYATLKISWTRENQQRDGEPQSLLVIGTLFDPRNQQTSRLCINNSARGIADKEEHTPFTVPMGVSRWGLRNKRLRRGDVDSYPALDALQTKRASELDVCKDRVKAILGKENLPPWFEKARQSGLRKFAQECPDLELRQDIEKWAASDDEKGRVQAFISKRLTARLEKGYELLAHDVFRSLLGGGIAGLKVEDVDIPTIVQSIDNYSDEALKLSQKYRHRAAVKKFVSLLRRIGVKYDMPMKEVKQDEVARYCKQCGGLITPSARACTVCASAPPAQPETSTGAAA